MKVKELIEILSKLDQEKEIRCEYDGFDSGFTGNIEIHEEGYYILE